MIWLDFLYGSHVSAAGFLTGETFIRLSVYTDSWSDWPVQYGMIRTGWKPRDGSLFITVFSVYYES